ncbi:MAG TPA: helix-turn-helix domain-containing protein [Gemmatimonadaceae bacterium]|nr:helix-turn-helix domain-containing protein [Gemmatimonadaceae bacterium]
MDVVAYLPRQLHSHLTIVLGSQHTLIAATGWEELRTVVQQHVTDVVVVDPLADGSPRTEVIEEIHRQDPSLPIVIYTTLSNVSTRALLTLGRIGLEHVVFNRFDDERRRFLELLERVPGQTLSDQMLKALSPELARLPAPVVRAIDQLFRAPVRFRNAQDLSAAAGTQLRTLYRQLDSAGIHSPRLLVAAARLLRSYALLRDPGRQIKEVAAKVGYHSQYQLTQHMRALAGHTPRTVRAFIEPEQFVNLLTAGVRSRLQPKRSYGRSRS